MPINDKVARPLIETLSPGTSLTGPFNAVERDSVIFSRSGGGGGLTQVLRSTDGGETKLPLTIAGDPWGSFTTDCNEPLWDETESGVTYWVQANGIDGNVTIRLSQ